MWEDTIVGVTCETSPDWSIEYPVGGICIIGHHPRVGDGGVTSREGSAPHTTHIPDLGHGDRDEVEDEAGHDGQEADDQVQGLGLGVNPRFVGEGEVDFEGQEILGVECNDKNQGCDKWQEWTIVVAQTGHQLRVARLSPGS